MDNCIDLQGNTTSRAQPAPAPTSIAGRLGQVLAWTANTIAAAVLVLGTALIVANWSSLGQEGSRGSAVKVQYNQHSGMWRAGIEQVGPWDYYPQAAPQASDPGRYDTLLIINPLQAVLSLALLITVIVIWLIGRAIRYVLTGPVPRAPWRILHRPAGEGVSEDWALQQRDAPKGPWITAAVYPTKQAAEAALRNVFR
jgi:hypothetical protein